jgi:phosphatidylserine/phosphatidylglycerophosphate/cardiolipin synthase-like enzyme
MKLLLIILVITVGLAEAALQDPTARAIIASRSALAPSHWQTSPSGLNFAQFLGDEQPNQIPQQQSLIGFSPQPTIELAFAPSPPGVALRLIEKVIGGARENIVMAAYELSSGPVAEALLAATRRGVRIWVVADQQESREETHSKLAALVHGGVLVRTDAKYSAMHHKFIIVDGRDVETGSYNYSYSAQWLNAENVVVFWNNTEIASKFSECFAELWNESVAFGDAP